MTRPQPSGAIVIRKARADDCPLLAAVERSAAEAFRVDPELAWLADQDPIDTPRHLELQEHGLCLVSVDADDRPHGFIVTERFGDALHIAELSVARQKQRRGLGRAMLKALEVAARDRGVKALTLTTFRDLPWNAPFYARCGFQHVRPGALDARMADVLQGDVFHGLPASRRCAMIKQL